MNQELELREASQMIAAVEAHGVRHPVNYLGKEIVWRQFGSGTPLVLLHGGHGSWLHWIRNVEVLATRRSVWVPDMPGYGDSDALDASAGLEDMLRALSAMFDVLFGPESKFDLGGFSFGGLVAANLAARRSSVRSLLTVGCGGHGGPRRETQRLINWRLKTGEGRVAALRHNLEAHMLADPDEADELALEIHTWSCENTRFRSKNISRSGTLQDILAVREFPLLMLWGSEDVTADPAHVMDKLVKGHPTREGHIIEGAGHWAQYERPDEVNRILVEWLDRF